MKDFFFLILGIALIIVSFYLFLTKPAPGHYQNVVEPIPTTAVTLVINDHSINAEVAETDYEKRRGLSGRVELPPNEALLLVFDSPNYHGIWMKGMNFPIDIVWIDENWVVVGVEREVRPDTFPNVFYPPEPVKYVLELSSGATLEAGIDTGSTVSLDR